MNIATEITTNNTKEKVRHMLGLTNSESTFSDERVTTIEQDWGEGTTTVFFTDESSIVISGHDVETNLTTTTMTKDEIDTEILRLASLYHNDVDDGADQDYAVRSLFSLSEDTGVDIAFVLLDKAIYNKVKRTQ